MRHDIIKTGDADAFAAIQDRNGEIVLSYCRRCRCGEGELTTECFGVTNEQINTLWRESCGTGSHHSANPDVMHDCIVAVNANGDFTGDEQSQARARCAELINARKSP